MRVLSEGDVSTLIVTGGMIGTGKTTVAKLLGEYFQSHVMFENVDNNKILPLFYTASREEQDKHRYSFLLQLEFLNHRFRDIKKALTLGENTVLDRSIYEDMYFAKVNTDLGRISELEFEIYQSLAKNMMEELDELPKKSPDVFVYLHAPFEIVLERISQRGRDFEQDEKLVDYYHRLWAGYEDWVDNYYDASEVVKVDTSVLDVVNNHEAPQELIAKVEEILRKVR